MRESTRLQLEADRRHIQTQIETIKSQGEFYLEAWISGSKPSGKKATYPRVQSRLPQFQGKKVKHIRVNEQIGEYQARCERGQQISKLMKAIERIGNRLNASE